MPTCKINSNFIHITHVTVSGLPSNQWMKFFKTCTRELSYIVRATKRLGYDLNYTDFLYNFTNIKELICCNNNLEQTPNLNQAQKNYISCKYKFTQMPAEVLAIKLINVT